VLMEAVTLSSQETSMENEREREREKKCLVGGKEREGRYRRILISVCKW
jgi:hypothetical protein